MKTQPKPKVSIVVISYNHDNYVGQALESFVNQKANFDFEIIIGDDCSTDKTTAIIKEYADKYPDLIKPILRSKNLGVQKNFEDTLNRAKGEYIALCECDDFWSDNSKIQIQSDYLDKNPETSLCFHPAHVFFEGKNEDKTIFPNEDDYKGFNTKELIRQNFIITNSVMYRNIKKIKIPDNILPVDWYVHLFYLQFGGIGYIDKIMSNYRRHENGLWWDSTKDVNKIWHKYGNAHLNLYIEMRKLFKDNQNYQKIIDRNINDAFGHIIEADESYKGNLLEEIINDYPEELASFVRRENIELKSKIDSNRQAQESANKLQAELELTSSKLKEQEQELDLIKQSRVWKLRNKLAGKLGR